MKVLECIIQILKIFMQMFAWHGTLSPLLVYMHIFMDPSTPLTLTPKCECNNAP